MKKLSSILCLLFILVFCNTVSAEYELKNSKTYELSKTYIIKNVGNTSAKDIKINVMVGKENGFTYQKDIKIEYNCKPYQLISDKFGNKIAEFEFDELSPFNNIEIQIVRNVTSYDIKFKVDAYSGNNSNKIQKEEFEIFLEPEKKIESDNEIIISKAADLENGITDNYNKARKIFEFVNSYMTYDESRSYRNKGALSAIKTGRGVCEDYASLFAALCRASGIPARVIGGYRLEEDIESLKQEEWREIEKSGHAWAEFYIEGEGWIPVEPTQLYTVNGVKEIYWKGFGGLQSSNYIAANIYNASKNDIDFSGFVAKEDEDNIILEPVKEMVRLKDTVQTSTDIDENTDGDEIITEPKEVINFIDLNKSNWAYAYINSVFKKGIIKGYEDNTFKASNKISRIEFMVMFSRMLKYTDYPAEIQEVFTFNDYPDNHWSKEDYEYIANCLENVEPSECEDGEISGQAALTRIFGSRLEINKPINREEAVALFDKFLNEYKEYESNFIDIENSKFKQSILKAYKNGLINGYSNGYFKPENNITRGEAAKLFDTYLKIEGY